MLCVCVHEFQHVLSSGFQLIHPPNSPELLKCREVNIMSNLHSDEQAVITAVIMLMSVRSLKLAAC